MCKIAIITDLHWGKKNDNVLLRNYFMEFFNNTFFPWVESAKPDAIVIPGDFYDRRKYINFETLYYVDTEFCQKLNSYNIPVHILLGNHDVYYKSTNKINSPLLLLSKFNNFIIEDKFRDVDIAGHSFAMLPWICPENQAEFEEFLQRTKSTAAFGHLELKDFEVHRGIKADEGMPSSALSTFHTVFSGHYHAKSDDGHIFYLGTPYDMDFSDLYETKGFHCLHPKKGTLEFIPNDQKMFFRLTYDDKDENPKFSGSYTNKYVKLVVKHKKSPVNYDKYMKALYETGPAEVDVVEDLDITNNDPDAIDETQDTLSIIFNQIEHNDKVSDKSKMKKLMSDLYTESHDIE